MAIEYVCDICSKQIEQHPVGEVDMLTVTIGGKILCRVMRNGEPSNTVRNVSKHFHIHSNCREKLYQLLSGARIKPASPVPKD